MHNVTGNGMRTSHTVPGYDAGLAVLIALLGLFLVLGIGFSPWLFEDDWNRRWRRPYTTTALVRVVEPAVAPEHTPMCTAEESKEDEPPPAYTTGVDARVRSAVGFIPNLARLKT
jgi:hypothetical protein